MSFVSSFLQSDWTVKATKYAYNPRRLKALVFQLGLFLSRKGLANLRKQIRLMYCYLRDIATGKYGIPIVRKEINSYCFLLIQLHWLLYLNMNYKCKNYE